MAVGTKEGIQVGKIVGSEVGIDEDGADDDGIDEDGYELGAYVEIEHSPTTGQASSLSAGQ